jgi:VWFA-related protein
LKVQFRWSTCVLALVVGSAGSGSSSAQAPPRLPSFGSEVELITVDVVAVDRNGRPVPDLTANDFVIEEDGKRQQIVNFEAFVAEPAPEVPSVSTTVATNQKVPAVVGRAFTLLLDDVGMTVARAAAARAAAGTFLERAVRDGDLVTVGTSSGEFWWSGRIPEGREDLRAVVDRVAGKRPPETEAFGRMSEYEAFHIRHYQDSPGAVREGVRDPRGGLPPPLDGRDSVKERVKQRYTGDNVCQPNMCDGFVRGRAAEIDARRRARISILGKALRRGLDALSPVRGRKSVLLFSEGFIQDFDDGLRGVAAASREVNAAIYFIDAHGLVAGVETGSAADAQRLQEARHGQRAAFEETTLESAGARDLADDTGGFSVRNTNDLATGAFRIANESRTFYLLGFNAAPGRPPGVWRKLKVSARNEGVTVRARRGYVVRKATPPAEAGKQPARLDSVVAGALDSARDTAGVPLRAMGHVLEPRANGATHLLVGVELDASQLTWQAGKSGQVAQAALSVVATHRDSGRAFRHDDALEIKAIEGQEPGWRAVTRDFEVPAGVVQLRVVVRDLLGGRGMGAVTQRLEVPLHDALRISTPILTDRMEPPSDGHPRPRPVLAVKREFDLTGRLFCQYEVFGAVRPGAGGIPRVSGGLVVRDAERRVVRDGAATLIAPDPDGRLVRFIGMGLDGLDEGSYEMVLTVRDEVSGGQLEHVEPFRLLKREAGW